MRATWAALRESLEASIRSPQSFQQFNDIKEKQPPLAGLASPAELVQFLADPAASAERRNALFRVLIGVAKANGAASALARNALLLSLSPALEAVCRRHVLRFPRPGKEVVSDVIADFFDSALGRDLSKVWQVAATLVRNTERDLARAQQRLGRSRSISGPLPEDDVDGACGQSHLVEPAILAVRRKGDDELAGVRAWLGSLVGSDADLVLAAVVGEENQRLVAEQLGISYQNTRVRLHRALRLLREHLKEEQQRL
jgi:RNA polymerase sigma-70 factor (ECF subfamily)